MGPVTYSIIIALVFLIGIIAFGFFETPHKTLKKGVKKIKEITFLNVMGKEKTSLTLRAQQQEKKGQEDLRVYVHEY